MFSTSSGSVFLGCPCSLVLSESPWQRGMPKGDSGQPQGSLAAAASTKVTTHAGTISAKCSAGTSVKQKAHRVVLPLPQQGKAFGDVSRQHNQDGKVKRLLVFWHPSLQRMRSAESTVLQTKRELVG